jgi:hypothetical protein
MTLLTLFSAPKPFTDPRVAMIQMNAISSWCRLEGADVLLLGEEQGLAEAALRLGARVLKDVRKNDLGTPLISSMVDSARRNGTGDLLCLINADMIIMRDLVEAALKARSRFDSFVMLGRRWDVDIAGPLDFSAGWESHVRAIVKQTGKLHRPAGSDFFVFPRACYATIPDFAVGRAGWDNWMIYKARQEGWPVIDCTRSVMIVHQNHDYSHLPGGVPHYSVPESNENIRLAGGQAPIRYTVLDATHILKNGVLAQPPLSFARLLRWLELLLRSVFSFLPSEKIEAVARPKRWKKRLQRFFGKQDRGSNGSGPRGEHG